MAHRSTGAAVERETKINITMIANTKIRVFAQLKDDHGNRLTLNFVDVTPPIPSYLKRALIPDHKFYDFHTLIWDVFDGSTWNLKAIITNEDLKDEHTNLWVSDIHSLNPDTGSAVIKIGDRDSEITYSWCEWDLCNKKQLRMIQACRLPFDSFNEPNDFT